MLALIKRIVLLTGLTALVAGIMFAAGCSFFNNRAADSGLSASGNENAAGTQQGIPGVNSGTIADIVRKTGPAVVQISVEKKTTGYYSDPFFNDPFFRDFFGATPQPRSERTETGLGSGFIISNDGYILTNEHVISAADKITVTVQNENKDYPAKLVGADYDLDLAVLKIQVDQELPLLKFGDSEKIEVGNWVIAIGNPYGFDHTVTVGVISAKGRPVPVEGRYYKNLLQTDAAINPGNSGGPLLDLQGDVVGINTAVAQAQGIGFAIPTSTVNGVLDDLKQKGKVIRPWLGIQMHDLTPDIAEYFGMESGEGVMVVGVVPDSPAQRAGLRQGDIILQIDKITVKDANSLADRIKEVEIGQKISLTVYRERTTMSIMVEIGEKPNDS